ncbi:MAG TPA: iron chelate uptake ABC transporter family permease subunit [Bacteroidota bacterium]|nr:iron chelate uptake ABC transporter family permease subunit [Bacteroidota bacterium]
MIEEIFSFPSTMLWPLAACLVLTGIHVYLGVHVIARKVIFVDLALAQIAALGTVTGVLLGYEAGKDVTALYIYSLAFTFFGAFIFSVTRMRGEKVPHEAIIGIVYAVTFAATILVLSKSALGPQELDHIIKGDLLWVQSHVVIKTALIYAAVGLFHFIFRKKFLAISFDAHDASSNGVNVRLWDLLFYMSFGFVITSSVAIAGVFLVFSYLVIPSVAAMLVAERISTRLALGWTGSAIISFIGVKLSWITGLPTSPLIVVLFAGALLLTGIFRYMRSAQRKVVAVRNMAGAVLVVGIFLGGVFFFRNPEEDALTHTLHLLASPLSTDRQAGLSDLKSYRNRDSLWLPSVIRLLHDQDAAVRIGAVNVLGDLKSKSAVQPLMGLLDDGSDEVVLAVLHAVQPIGDSSDASTLVARAGKIDDREMKTEFLRAALRMGDPAAIPELIGVVADGGVFAADALDAIKGSVRLPSGMETPARLKRWWAANRGRIRREASTGIFYLPG